MKKLLITGSSLKAQVTKNVAPNGDEISRHIEGTITLSFESSGNFGEYAGKDGLLDIDRLYADILPKLPVNIEL